jgi:hypothetical protein
MFETVQILAGLQRDLANYVKEKASFSFVVMCVNIFDEIVVIR